MPFCQNCGRQLAENEVCNCTANQNYTNNNFNQPPPQPQPYINNVQIQQPKKKSSCCLVAVIVSILIVVLIILGILAAILVPSMIGYTKKSKYASANANASSIRRAFSSALAEMDEAGYNVSGTYLISSEKDGNVSVVGYRDDSAKKDFDFSIAESKAKQYFDFGNLQWFVVCENGVVTYAACAEKWKVDVPGTYPPGGFKTGPHFYSSNTKSKSDATLQDVFDDAYLTVKSK